MGSDCSLSIRGLMWYSSCWTARPLEGQDSIWASEVLDKNANELMLKFVNAGTQLAISPI